MEVLITKLIEFLESASPELWRILVKQSYVSGTQFLVGAFIGLFFIIACVVLWTKTRRREEELEHVEGHAEENFADAYDFSAIGIIIGALILVIFLTIAIGRFANPEYHAVKEIIEMLSK